MRLPATRMRLGHVHVGVRDRRLAAAWYRCVLQLRVTYDYARHGDAHGPVARSGDCDKTHVALFVDAAPGRGRTHIGPLAFRVPGAAFVHLLCRPARLGLGEPGRDRVRPEGVADQGSSYSLYVADPTAIRWKSPVTITARSNAP
jgi:catechol 2,3-dioxygenase-like lactoylglutathione lyase family enzyme